MSRKKQRNLQSPEQVKRDLANNKRLRIIYVFLIIMGIFTLSGGAIIGYRKWFIADLYHAFLYDSIGTAFLYLAGITLLLFFIYASLVITLKNPQSIKKTQVAAWGGTGIICLALTVFIFQELSSLTMNSIRDIQDYKNGVVKVENLTVVDVYTGGGRYSNNDIALIETEKHDLTLLLDLFRLEEGKTYRFTFMERTGTILNIEKIDL
ncbi:hypothetical protein A8F94_22810 [Bacillus sp. FJAT-27225]|uniref:hypothetical protein n=1 Tax=Bacillus sp. FJAT-27225 TaxID=1743144 RepID=UPI00080C3559|nr:hypothetical protein [Bacillus sp. FJAT-27225]OCA81691.1 hypothetical protein A8F94_22810 [Bacillus sp. FJAT-27225]